MASKTWVPIAQAFLTENNSTIIEFSAIPATYSHLILSVDAALHNGASTVNIIFNDNSPSATYTQVDFWYTTGNGGQIGSTYGAWRFMGDQVGIQDSIPSTSQIEIMNYADTSKFKAGFARQGQSNAVGQSNFLWRSTNAISKISIRINSTGPYWRSGSSFVLWGVA